MKEWPGEGEWGNSDTRSTRKPLPPVGRETKREETLFPDLWMLETCTSMGPPSWSLGHKEKGLSSGSQIHGAAVVPAGDVTQSRECVEEILWLVFCPPISCQGLS